MNRSFLTKSMWVLFGALFIIGAAVPSIFFYNKYRAAQSALQNPTAFVQTETKQLKEKVGKLIELPQDEEPTVATVTDADRLKEQLFFANAQNGDRVLIFTQARKAILYRPSTNKIIEVAPVNIGQTATPSGSLGTSPSAKLGTSPAPQKTSPTITPKLTPTKTSTPSQQP